MARATSLHHFMRVATCHLGGASGTWWSFDPWVWVPLALLVWFYARGALLLGARAPSPGERAFFVLAVAALFLALVWPLEVLARLSFAAHMAQHMLLIAVAAPLLVLSRPSSPLLAAMPHRARRALGSTFRFFRPALRPGVAFALHGSAIWLGHAPRVIHWALEHHAVHFLEHAALLGTALVFWRSLTRGGAAGYGMATLFALATMLHTGALGALITFAPRVFYLGYTLEDQQLAGLIMWVPGGALYLGAGLAFAGAWLRHMERGQRAV
jgi:putative membrane protein